WMTAGRGIIHGENVATRGRVRILQLWLTLPKAQRWTEPAFQDIHTDAVPTRQEPGVQVRVYSGSSRDQRSATRNHVPVTLIEAAMRPQASFDQDLPIAFNGFVFVVDGAVRVGEGADATMLKSGEVGWLDRPEARTAAETGSVLRLTAQENGARLVLY